MRLTRDVCSRVLRTKWFQRSEPLFELKLHAHFHRSSIISCHSTLKRFQRIVAWSRQVVLLHRFRPWKVVFISRSTLGYNNEFGLYLSIRCAQRETWKYHQNEIRPKHRLARHTSSDRLLYVQHTGEIGPAVLVHDRFCRADYPAEWLGTDCHE